jgi:Sec-independent protein translocase protein TatA
VNFSISEILLVLLIALLVVKPEQLPDVAQKLGRMVKSVRGLIAKLKEDMNGFIDPRDNQNEQPK